MKKMVGAVMLGKNTFVLAFLLLYSCFGVPLVITCSRNIQLMRRVSRRGSILSLQYVVVYVMKSIFHWKTRKYNWEKKLEKGVSCTT